MAPERKTIDFRLPISIITTADISRLIRELESLDNFLMQAAARKTGQPMQLPRMSLVLEHLAEDNQLTLLQAEDRATLMGVLKKIQDSAPVAHLSFASNPSAAFTGKVLEWFRREAHPYTLLTIGLQPAIGAGFTLRTTNKFFNFSLNKHFEAKRDLLHKALTDGETA